MLKSFENADRIKKRILALYRQDITKFSRWYEAKVLSIFDEMPSQLSKTEKKYKLSGISKGAGFRDYENAFLWLTEAMIINNCHNATEPTVGLSMSEEHTTRKCYMADADFSRCGTEEGESMRNQDSGIIRGSFRWDAGLYTCQRFGLRFFYI